MRISDLIRIRGPRKTVVRRGRRLYTEYRVMVETPGRLRVYTLCRYTIPVVAWGDLEEAQHE